MKTVEVLHGLDSEGMWPRISDEKREQAAPENDQPAYFIEP
jgi:hypothetical protein